MQYETFMPDPHKAPPTIVFDDTIISGITPMQKGSPFDEIIDRPAGMQGYILNLTIEGQGLIKDGEQNFICRKGDLLLFHPYTPHYYHIAPQCNCWYHQWVYFYPKAYWHEALDWHNSLHKVQRYTLSDENFEEFSNLFLEIIKRTNSKAGVSRMLAVNFLELLLWRRLELCSDTEHNLQADSRISAAQIYMRDNLSDPKLSLEKIATQVHLSTTRLVHLFAERLGTSPIKWLNQEKLKVARLLLTTTDCSIEEIASRSGFSDVTYFFRFFKKHELMTPMQYRNDKNTYPQKVDR